MGLDIDDHLTESGVTCLLRHLHVHVFLRYREAMRGRILQNNFNCAGIEKPSFSCSLGDAQQ
jgi:hypothetical protein